MSYKNLNISRISQEGNITSTDLFLNNYFKNILNNQKLNDKIPRFKNMDDDDKCKYLRVMTWNIRYFTNAKNKPTINNILQAVIDIEPDILCLNEVSLGENIFYDNENINHDPIKTFKENGYRVLSMCNVVPAWYSSFYGNMILIKNDFYEMMCSSSLVSKFDIINLNNKCFFNQRIGVYQYPKSGQKIIDNTNIERIDNNETRCYIKISLGNFDLIATHLEAYNKEVREKQFDELMKQCTRKTIILGDFNIINTKSYPREYKNEYEWKTIRDKNIIYDNENDEIVKFKNKYKLMDSFEITNNKYCGFTTWINTIVDYIFFKNWDNLINDEDIKSYVYFTDASDHLPIIVDIKDEMIDWIKKSYINRNDQSLLEIKTLPLKNFISVFPFLYNIEPLRAYDWFDNGEMNSNYSFSDRYLTGNFNLTLGSVGIYTSTHISKSANFLRALINKTDQKEKMLSSKYINDTSQIEIGLLYTFISNPNVDISSSIVANTPINDKYLNDYDYQYDLVVVDDLEDYQYEYFTSIEKITPKGKNVFLLSSIDIIIYPVNLIDIFVDLDIEIAKLAKEELFINALQYIHFVHNIDKSPYSLENNGYGKFDESKIHELSVDISWIEQEKAFITCPAYKIYQHDTNEIYKQNGGKINNYKDKYIKYKKKYLKLKNII